MPIISCFLCYFFDNKKYSWNGFVKNYIEIEWILFLIVFAMKISLELKSVIEILDIASRFVSKNSTLPILQNIYLKASIDTLLVRATDMEKYIEIEQPCNVQIEWAITVNAKTFMDIMKTIDTDVVEFTVDQKSNIMTIKTTKDTFEINWIPASEYVALPEVPQDNSLTLDTSIFVKWLDKVEYAVWEKSFSPVLTWVVMKSKMEDGQPKIIFVWTDSFRLSEFKTLNTHSDDFCLIIPKVAIWDIWQVVKYAVDKEVPDMIVKYSENLVAFELVIDWVKVVATSLLVQGNFPEYEREEVMPTQFTGKIMLDKKDCENAIKKIAILTRDINNFIQIETQGTKVLISSWKTDKWAWTTEIPAIIDWEAVSFAVNGRYITDFIRAMASDTLVFNVVNGQKPLVLMDKDDDTNRYVVRPLTNI